MTLERDIEKYLIQSVKQSGGECRKVKWIGRNGAPDRLVLLNGPHFVELKSSKGKLSIAQEREIERMRYHKVTVHVINSFEKVNSFIKKCIK